MNKILYKLLLASALAGSVLGAIAAPIVATPGSLAGYTYFPPSSGSSGSGGTGGGDNVSTLQRCFWTPNTGDRTVTVSSDEFYDMKKDITVYYRMAGGNGGASIVGGGGGSSAILKNGSVVAVGKGGDGGQAAPEVAGTFTIAKGDVLRFITGGGGGDGRVSPTIIGGGGGAGYMGGGGGGGKIEASTISTDATTGPGKGGGATPGKGGYISGGFSGTDGSFLKGGVTTWPDGSSAPVGGTSGGGSSYSNSYSYWVCDWCGPGGWPGASVSGVMAVKFPASGLMHGSVTGSLPNDSTSMYASPPKGQFSGGGGALGNGGGAAVTLQLATCSNASATVLDTADSVYVGGNQSCATYYSTYTYYKTSMSHFPAPSSTDFKLTRQGRVYNPSDSVGNNWANYVGSIPGQILAMYQAPVCGILK